MFLKVHNICSCRQSEARQLEKAKNLGRWWLNKIPMSAFKLREKIMAKDYTPEIAAMAVQELTQEVSDYKLSKYFFSHLAELYQLLCNFT